MGDTHALPDDNRSAWGWAPELWLVMAAGAVTYLLIDGILLELDLAVRDLVAAGQVPALYALARGLNFAGSANLLAGCALLLAAPVVARARSWPVTVALLRPIVVAFALSYLVVGPIKFWTDRAAPGDPSRDAAVLFAHPTGWSYPSGHVVNAVLWYGVLLMLIDALLRWYGRAPLAPWCRRLLRVGPPVVVCLTVTYLNFHWLTDAVVGVLLGLLLDRLLQRLEWRWPTAASFAPAPVGAVAKRAER